MKYIITIPSYNRVDTLIKKTLNTLHHNKINPKIIYIFVANIKEYNLYKNKIPKNLYNKIVIGLKGLRNQRNFIRKYFNDGDKIIEMDDDVTKINELYIKKPNIGKKSHKIRNITNLNLFFVNAFKSLLKNNLTLFGVYPVNNPYFMSNNVTTDLRFIVGPMWGMINSHNKNKFLYIDEKEDVLRTLLHYKSDHGVLRYNNISFNTAYYTEKGGMQSEGKDRKKEALKSAKLLIKKFPYYCKLYLGKKSGHPEVRLRDRTLKNKQKCTRTRKKLHT